MGTGGRDTSFYIGASQYCAHTAQDPAQGPAPDPRTPEIGLSQKQTCKIFCTPLPEDRPCFLPRTCYLVSYMTDEDRKRFLDQHVPAITEAIDKAIHNLVDELGEEGQDTATLFADLFVSLVSVMRESGQNYPQEIFDAAYVDALSLHGDYEPDRFLSIFEEPADPRFELPALATKNEQSN